MQQKMGKGAILAAIGLCLSVAGLVVIMLLTLWNESWMIGQMEKSDYYSAAARVARADCAEIISQSGVLGNIIEDFIPDDIVRQDIILSTDALFRNSGAVTSSRFSNLKTTIEDIVYEETKQILSEADQSMNTAIQFQCEQRYAQNVKTPFFTAISILLQYKQVSTPLLIAVLAIVFIGVIGLFVLSDTYQQLFVSLAKALTTAGIALFLFGVVVLYCGFQNWMPNANIEYTLFVNWFRGLPIGCLLGGIVMMLCAGGVMWHSSKSHKGA